MDRIQEIIRLEQESVKPDSKVSELRWAAARLIYEELETKSVRQLSEEIKAEGGAGSLGHLTRMKKCWQLTGKDIAESAHDDYRPSYPVFNDIYHSPEVRGESENREREKARQPKPEESAEPQGKKQKRSKEPADSGPGHNYTAHGMVIAAHEAITTLAKNPETYRPFFKDGDQEKLASLIPLIESITRETSVTGKTALSST